MASYGGYDCKFVEKPPKVVQSECPVCLQIIREPYQADCCGYAYCRVCIEQIELTNKPCPCCKAEKFDKFEDKRLKRTLHEFKVYCTNQEQGCKWIGELSQLDKHLDSNPSQEKQLEGCQYTEVKCCHCYKLFQRSDILIHQSKQCPRRPFSCKYCKNFDSNYEDVTTNHWPKCGDYPVQCTNSCGKSIKRGHLKDHISDDCLMTVIDCEFSHIGCEVKLPRQDMPTHLTENLIEHVSLQAEYNKQVISQINQLKKENRQLKMQVAKLTQHLEVEEKCTPIALCPPVFTMTNFEQHKVDDDEWISPPFYTHPKGYKMCITVAANSFDEYDGTHTAVGVRLMKGEFDDMLKWPFRGHITVHLISQIDEEYEEAVIDFTDFTTDDSIGSRVLTDEIAEAGLSSTDFISHTDLQSKYLRKNCLKLCAYQYTKL